MKAVVRRVLAARSDLGDCDSAPSLLDRRFLACTITSCVGIDRTKGRRGRDHRGIARPGEAVVSSLPALALLQLVRLGSDAAVEGRWLLPHASDSQTRLQAAADRAACKHFGDSCSRDKAGLSADPAEDSTASRPEMRACGESQGADELATGHLLPSHRGIRGHSLAHPLSCASLPHSRTIARASATLLGRSQALPSRPGQQSALAGIPQGSAQPPRCLSPAKASVTAPLDGGAADRSNFDALAVAEAGEPFVRTRKPPSPRRSASQACSSAHVLVWSSSACSGVSVAPASHAASHAAGSTALRVLGSHSSRIWMMSQASST